MQRALSVFVAAAVAVGSLSVGTLPAQATLRAPAAVESAAPAQIIEVRHQRREWRRHGRHDNRWQHRRQHRPHYRRHHHEFFFGFPFVFPQPYFYHHRRNCHRGWDGRLYCYR
jgi:hypothetical protein